MRIYLCDCDNADNRKRVETVLKLSGHRLINPQSLLRLPLSKDEYKTLQHLLIGFADEVWLMRDWESTPRAVEEKTYADIVRKPVKIQGRNWKKFV